MDTVNKTVAAANEVEIKEREVLKVEEGFKSFCIANNIKHGSKTFYKYQHIYFNGAIAVLGETPAKWGVYIMSSRPIIEKY